jgi:hypothetical protein
LVVYQLKLKEEKKVRNRTYNDVMFERTQLTPCHPSRHGSPPKAIHPIKFGYSMLTYKLFIAMTAKERKEIAYTEAAVVIALENSQKK